MNTSLLHNQRRRILVILFCFFAILQSGLRSIENSSLEGDDTPNYQYTYNEVDGTSWSTLCNQFTYYSSEYEGREGGYAFLIKATQLVYNDFRFFMFLTAAIFIIPLGMIIYRYVESYEGLILSFVIYFALFDNIVNCLMRQAVVLGMFLFSLRYVLLQEWKKYFTVLALLFTIHNSIVLAIPFYFLPKFCSSRKWILIAFVVGLFMSVFSAVILSRLVIGTVYEVYGESDSYGLISLLILICFVSYYAYMLYDKVAMIKDYKLLICGVIGTLICMPFIRIGGAFVRTSYYYFLFFVPLIPVIIDCALKNRFQRRIVYSLAISFFLFYIIR